MPYCTDCNSESECTECDSTNNWLTKDGEFCSPEIDKCAGAEYIDVFIEWDDDPYFRCLNCT